MSKEIISTFIIGKTKWEIVETTQTFIKRAVEVEEVNYWITKNGRDWSNSNGPNYESETEAEINILMQYRVGV